MLNSSQKCCSYPKFRSGTGSFGVTLPQVSLAEVGKMRLSTFVLYPGGGGGRGRGCGEKYVTYEAVPLCGTTAKDCTDAFFTS
jgi:hypothetical protein